jgi:hypothetical protein
MAGIHLNNLSKKVFEKYFNHNRNDSSKFSNESGQFFRSRKKINTISSNKYKVLTNSLKKNNYFINGLR